MSPLSRRSARSWPAWAALLLAPLAAAAPTLAPAHTPAAAAVAAVAAVAADPPVAPVPTASAELDQLMDLLARRRHAQADFDEQQYLAVLTVPLVSSGTLIYEAPDHLEQHTLRPRRQTMVLDHGVLTLQIGRHRRSVALADYPQFAPLIDSIRATLAGDRAALEQVFKLQLHGGLDRWQLRLEPRAPQLAATIRDIVIDGAQAQIDEVQVRQSNGDHSVLQIRPHP